MAPPTLPVSSLINVNVTLTPQGAQAQNLNALLILGSSAVIDVVTRIRSYTTLEEVATDFGTSAPEYLAAVLWFEQNPQPAQLYIGRWAETATAGQLFGAPLSPTNTLPATWTAIANGSFHIAIDGGAAQSLVGLNFTGAANLNGVAAVIGAALVGATIVYNSVYNRFEVTSDTTGGLSAVSFATAGAGGTDISAMLGLRVTSSGAYQAGGIAAETALAAVTYFDATFGQQWFGLTVLGAQDADHLAIAPYIEGANNKHVYGITTQEGGVLVPGDTSDIAYLLSEQGFNRTMVQYSSENTYAVVSAMARILTTDYGGNNTTITLMYKQEPGVIAENLNSTQMAALLAKNCNVFVNYDNNTAIIQPGVMSSGIFCDSSLGIMALAVTMEAAIYNLLFTSPTKIAQTDAGTHILETTITSVLAQFAQNGLIGPGQWNSQGFGALNEGDEMPTGYYVFAPPVATQQQTQRAARISVPIQIAVKLAGAVQSVNVSILVNS